MEPNEKDLEIMREATRRAVLGRKAEERSRMEVTLTLSLTEAQIRFLRENSLERVFNTAIFFSGRSRHPDASINHEDLRRTKYFVTYLWNMVREATFTGKASAASLPNFTVEP